LKLAERVAMSRTNLRKYAPGVREPAHNIELQESDFSATKALNPALIKPGVREPAHFINVADLMANPEKQVLLHELSALLKKMSS
jgi:hypothetical protein